MFRGLIANALEQVGVVEVLIDTHDAFAASRPIEQQRAIKEYAVASCVTRLYAIYERFIESIIADYLDAVPEIVPFESLSEGLRSEYRIGISHVLSKIDGDRYAHLSHENIIRWYYEALTGACSYRIVAEALTRHDNNLRLEVLEALVSRVDLKDFRGWLAHAPDIVALYEEQTAIPEQLASELRSFIQTRNDAAHGVLESLEGREILLRHCQLVRALVNVTGAYFHKQLLIRRVQVGRMRRVGQVTEVFSQPGAFVATVDEGHELRRGMTVHLVASNYCIAQEISSLRVDDVDEEIVQTTRPEFEVGIKCAFIPRRNTEIFVDA